MEPVYLFGGPRPPSKPTEEERAHERKLKRRRGFIASTAAAGVGLCGFVAGGWIRPSLEIEPATKEPLDDSASVIVREARAIVEGTNVGDLRVHANLLCAALEYSNDDPTLVLGLQILVDQVINEGASGDDGPLLRMLTQSVARRSQEPRWAERYSRLKLL